MDMDFQALVLHNLAHVFFHNPRDFIYNSSQCNNLSHAFVAKLSKYSLNNCHFLSPPQELRFTKSRAVRILKSGSPGSKIMQTAWKEIYRVVKEAEIYVKNCSKRNWWIESIILSSTGEAHAVHIHDLAWSIVCSDLNLLYSDGETEESYSAAASGIIGGFRAEMSNLTRIHDEYEDKKRLVFTFQKISKACRQMAEESTLSAEEKNKMGIARFVWAKVEATIRSEPAIKGGRLSSWLQIDPNDFVPKLRVIGMGSCGEVYEGSWLGVKVAVKEMHIAAGGMDDLLQTEIVLHAKLRSPFIVQLIGVCITGAHCYLVMELVSSNLERILEARSEGERPPLSLPVAVDVMLQISRGMEYLHSQRVMHRDLKAANVLLQPSAVPEFRDEGYGRVKLCDFGEASLRLYSFRSTEDARGTCNWRAPEVFQYPQQGYEIETETLKEYTYKADVYSFAMTCYEILTGKYPFGGVLPTKIYGMIVQGKRPTLPRSCPLMLADYIKICWDTDPRRRPTFADVSNFMRYMKLLIMRMNDPRDWNSSCKDFDKAELVKSGEEEGGFDERPLNSEEEGLIIRALDGEFPGFFQPRPVSQQNAQPFSPAFKVFVNLPDYIQQYSYEEVRNATDNFSSKVSGVSCLMWKGTLSDGTQVAVKKQQLVISMKEIAILCQLHHPNAVRLRGVSPGSEAFVAYDHMVMGSLGAQLFRQRSILNWNTRRKIGFGIANFLGYLHEDYGKRFLKLQVRSTNIHLDEGFNPKFCGFESVIPIGMNAELLSSSEQQKLEVAMQFEEFRNVQDFGIILLELLTGCKWENMRYSLRSIHYYIQTKRSDFMERLVDKQLQKEGELGEREAMRWVKVALCCFARPPSQKPSMRKVVLMLKGLEKSSPLPEKGTLEGFKRGQRGDLIPQDHLSNKEASEMMVAWLDVKKALSEKVGLPFYFDVYR